MSTAERAAQRLAWARQVLAHPTLQLQPASSDASFRSYWRTTGVAPSRIVMDAPPDKEDLGPWLSIAERLRAAGLHAPAVHARDQAAGFLLLTDLGSRTLLPALDADTADALYAQAIDILLRMQANVAADDLPAYDENRLIAEMELLPTWFLQRHLGFSIACEEWDVIESAFRLLVDSALAQPQRFVHRDYHSRNLMLPSTAGGELGIIDFQDAVRGPISYDLVSLLRDAYVEWPEARVAGWMEDYRQRAVALGLTGLDAHAFRRAFDLMGLQRHLKVLGIFCRLYYRDGKAGYLGDLDRVWRYARDIGRRYLDIAPLIDLIERAIDGRDLSRPCAP